MDKEQLLNVIVCFFSCDLLSNSFQILEFGILEFGFPSSTCVGMALKYHFSCWLCGHTRLLYYL